MLSSTALVFHSQVQIVERLGQLLKHNRHLGETTCIVVHRKTIRLGGRVNEQCCPHQIIIFIGDFRFGGAEVVE